MSVAEVGSYMRLLCYQWEHGSVPADHAGKIARIINDTDAAALWTVIADKFPRTEQGSYQNARLERVRTELTAYQDNGGIERRKVRSGTKPAQYVRTLTPAFASASAPTDRTPTPANGDAVTSGSNERDGSTSAETRFARFWSAYPKKIGRDAAWREWLKRSPSDDLTDRMVAKVHEQRASAQWLKDGGQYIPHPRTWLHQGRWQDEDEIAEQADLYGHIPPCRTHDECIAKRLGRAPT